MRTRTTFLRSLLFATLFAPFVITPDGLRNASAQVAPDFKEIKQVWATRQEKIRSATFKLRLEKELFGPINPPRPADTKRRSVEEYVLKIKDEKVFQHHKNQFGNFWRGYDGQESRILQKPNERQIVGIIGKEKYRFTNDYIGTWPIFLWARPDYDNMVNFDWSKYVVSEVTKANNGRECVELTPNDGRDYAINLSLVRAEYEPVQITSYKDGRLSFEVKIEYSKSEKIGVYPSKWSLVDLNDDGTISMTTNFEVVDVSFNEDIPDEDFRIEFPNGTNVVDQAAGQRSLPLAPGINQDDLPTVETIIDEHIRAIGGEMTLASIETVTIEAYLEGKNGRTSGPVVFLSKDDKWIHVFRIPDIKKRGFDAQEMWESYGNDVVELGIKSQVKCHEIVPSLTKPLTWRKYDGEIVLIGRTLIGDKKCYQIEFRPNGGDLVTRFFDPDSKMLVKISYQYDDRMRGEQYFSDFRIVDGVTVPFVREQYYSRNGEFKHEYTMRNANVELDQFLKDDLFVKRAVTKADLELVDQNR